MTAVCPGCEKPNDARRRFCGGCGKRLREPCARCAFENESGDRFCGGCGEATSGMQGAAHGGAQLAEASHARQPPAAASDAPGAPMLRALSSVPGIVKATVAALAPEPSAAPSRDELSELLSLQPKAQASRPGVVSHSSGKVSQEDIDALFGEA